MRLLITGMLVLLTVAAAAEARQDTWDTLGLRVDHTFPDVSIRPGDTFWAAGESHETGGGGITATGWKDFEYAGCELLELIQVNSTTSSSWKAQFRMTDISCVWSFTAEGTDEFPVDEIQALIYATGSVQPYEITGVYGPQSLLVQTVATFLTTLAFIVFAVWAEKQKTNALYVAANFAGVLAVINPPEALEGARVMLILAVVYMMGRAVLNFSESKERENSED